MLDRLLAAVAAALFGMLLLTFGQIEYSISQQPPPHYGKEPTKTENQYGSDTKPRPRFYEKKNDTKGKDKRYWYNTFSDHPTEWLLTLFTGILALYTARLFFATSGLVSAAEEQSRELKKSVVESAKASKAAVDALDLSQKGIDSARDVGQAQVRAYVAVSNFTLTIGEDRKPIFRFTCTNAGQSPARFIQISIIGFFDFGGPMQIGRGTILPDDLPAGAERPVSIHCDAMSAGFLEMISSIFTRITIQGTVRFLDVFKQPWIEPFDYWFITNATGTDFSIPKTLSRPPTQIWPTQKG